MNKLWGPFKVGDIVRYSYNPDGHHTPGWYRARITKMDDKFYYIDLLEYYGYWTEKTLQDFHESRERADSLWERVPEEINKKVESFRYDGIRKELGNIIWSDKSGTHHTAPIGKNTESSPLIEKKKVYVVQFFKAGNYRIEGVYTSLDLARKKIPENIRALEVEHNSHGLWWSYDEGYPTEQIPDHDWFISEEDLSE